MSAIRVRTPGNNPSTRLYCDWMDPQGSGCRRNGVPIEQWDAREARRVARSLGWARIEGRDYCPDHATSSR